LKNNKNKTPHQKINSETRSIMQNVYAILALIFWILICTVKGSDADIKNYEDIRKTMKKQYRSYNRNVDKNFKEKMKNMLPRDINPEWIKNLTPLKDEECDNNGKNERKNFDISTPWNSRHNDGRNIMMQKYRNFRTFYKIFPMNPDHTPVCGWDFSSQKQPQQPQPRPQQLAATHGKNSRRPGYDPDINYKKFSMNPDINDKKDIRKSMQKYRSEPNLHEIKSDDKNQDKNNRKSPAIGNKERKDSNLTQTHLSNSVPKEYNESRKMMKKYRSIPKFEHVMERIQKYEEKEQSHLEFHLRQIHQAQMTKQNQKDLELEFANIAIVFKESDNVIKEIFKE